MKSILIINDIAVSKVFDETKAHQCMEVFQEALDNGAIVVIIPNKADVKIALSKLNRNFKIIEKN